MEGIVESYVHQNRISATIEIITDTDFASRTDEMKHIAHELCLQIASMNPSSVDELLSQPYVKEPSRTVKEVLDEVVNKLKENIYIRRIHRMALGE